MVIQEMKRGISSFSNPDTSREKILTSFFPENNSFNSNIVVNKIPCKCSVLLLDPEGRRAVGIPIEEGFVSVARNWVLVAVDECRNIQLSVEIPQEVRNATKEKDGESWVETRNNAGISYVLSESVQKSLNKEN